MSRQYTSDGKRRSSMTHARRTWTCPCGRELNGNGGISSHKRACRTWMEYWLPRLENLLAGHALTNTRWQLEAERDQARAWLAAHPAGHWLIVYDRPRGKLLRCQAYPDSQEALAERFRLERENRGDAGLEIAVLGAESLAAMKKTHGRYFAGGMPGDREGR